ncbi:hypothetical protein [uncultured Jatrophihabitans sp.]|uniref:hypothetical protein n=1 Tax=uncultured Jatrophihabitans sp. TaxID=1610747 RepID=UPI0035C94958
MSAVLAATTLAKSGEAVKAGPIGLAVILLLCIACYFLFKSMSGHMRRVRENFPVDAPPPPRAAQSARPVDPQAQAQSARPVDPQAQAQTHAADHRPPLAAPAEPPEPRPDQASE